MILIMYFDMIRENVSFIQQVMDAYILKIKYNKIVIEIILFIIIV